MITLCQRHTFDKNIYTYSIKNSFSTLIDNIIHFICGKGMKSNKNINGTNSNNAGHYDILVNACLRIVLWHYTPKSVVFRQFTWRLEDLTIRHFYHLGLLIWPNQVNFLCKDQSDLLWKENPYRITFLSMI